jgi:hypothetical protein
MGRANVVIDQLVVRISIVSETLHTRETAGEINATGRQQGLAAAVSQLRSTPETVSLATLKRSAWRLLNAW